MSNSGLIDEKTSGVYIISITPFSEDANMHIEIPQWLQEEIIFPLDNINLVKNGWYTNKEIYSEVYERYHI